MTSRSRPHASIWALLAIAGVVLGCRHQQPQPRVLLDEEAMLKGQIEGLRELLDRAERGTLFPSDRIVVSVREQLVKEMAQLTLPREQVIGNRYRVRLETVDVRFQDKNGSVRLDGRVSPVDRSPEDFFADVAVFGMMDSVELDGASSVLTARVSMIGFELKRVGVFGETRLGRRLLQELAERHADDLRALVFPVTIPVHLETEIALPALTASGPVRVRGASVPLSVKVADVVAHGRRLWVAVEVSAGEWKQTR
jgi:hypothetical protein